MLLSRMQSVRPFQRNRRKSLQRARCRIHNDAGVFQCDHAENRFDASWAKNDLSDRFRTEKGNAREADVVLHRLSVCEFVSDLSLRLDAGLQKLVARRQAINGTCIDKKIGFVSLTFAAQLL